MENEKKENKGNKLDVNTLILWAQAGGFDDFCQKVSQYMPTDSAKNREQAREIYDLIKDGADRDKILATLEHSLDERERKGMAKGVAVGAGVTLAAGLLAAFLINKKE